MDLHAFRRDLVEDAADLRTVALPNLIDEALRRNAHIERVAFLRDEASGREPVLILRPVNDLLEAGEDLLPNVHWRAEPYVVENPQLFHSCGKSGCGIGAWSLHSVGSRMQWKK